MKYTKEIVHEPSGIYKRHMSATILKARPFADAKAKQGGYGVLTDDFWVCRVADRGFHVLIYTFDGCGKVILEDNTQIELRKGSLFISWATGQGHYEATKEAQQWDMFWMSFWADSPNFRQTDNDYTLLEFDETDEIKNIVCNILKEELYQDSVSSRALDMYEQLLLLHMERSLSTAESVNLKKHRQEFFELFQNVSKDLDKKWTIQDLCRESGYSRTHLTRLCLSLYGKNPGQIISDMRMDQAKVLLMSTSDSIGFIAQSVGYERISNFTTAFKKEFGVTPRQFRKNNGNIGS